MGSLHLGGLQFIIGDNTLDILPLSNEANVANDLEVPMEFLVWYRPNGHMDIMKELLSWYSANVV